MYNISRIVLRAAVILTSVKYHFMQPCKKRFQLDRFEKPFEYRYVSRKHCLKSSNFDISFGVGKSVLYLHRICIGNLQLPALLVVPWIHLSQIYRKKYFLRFFMTAGVILLYHVWKYYWVFFYINKSNFYGILRKSFVSKVPACIWRIIYFKSFLLNVFDISISMVHYFK